MRKEDKVVILSVLTILIILSILFYIVYDEAPKYETYTEDVYSRVVKLHERQEATNNRGDFKNVYEALFEDGTVRELDLEVYLAVKEGDTLYWQEEFRRLKNK